MLLIRLTRSQKVDGEKEQTWDLKCNVCFSDQLNVKFYATK